jgi:3-dehydroquinate dehydratase / shikimate dehydrogenase
MICVVITGPTFEEAHQQLSQALSSADLVELRLDLFVSLDLVSLKKLRSHFSIPMIYTLRDQSQGGSYIRAESQRLDDIRTLATLNPEFIDLETHVPSCFIAEMALSHPEIKLILSYHNFDHTPQDLEGLYREMQKIPACFYKVALFAQNALDVMRLLCLAKKTTTTDPKLIAISMGPHGQLSRILSPFIYAPLTEKLKTAPGQVPLQTLIGRYHRLRSNNPPLYGLIGDPVEQSISDETHNHLMRVCHLEGVYVKIQVALSELESFLHLAKQLPFQGLSVTMPLKEKIIPLLDHVDPQALEIGSVNTLVFKAGKLYGFNTDGIGALEALSKHTSVRAKRMVLIGAGGSAKAIAYESLKRGALVTIVNRDSSKAHRLAHQLHCIGKGLDEMAMCCEEGYDILINATPSPLPIAPGTILPQALVMDITTQPRETEFLKQAKERGCRVVYGYEMFIEQALGQFKLWFKERFEAQAWRKILEEGAPLNHLQD